MKCLNRIGKNNFRMEVRYLIMAMATDGWWVRHFPVEQGNFVWNRAFCVEWILSFNIKIAFRGFGIFIIKIKWSWRSWDPLIFMMRISLHVRRHICIETPDSTLKDGNDKSYILYMFNLQFADDMFRCIFLNEDLRILIPDDPVQWPIYASPGLNELKT